MYYPIYSDTLEYVNDTTQLTDTNSITYALRISHAHTRAQGHKIKKTNHDK